MLRAPHQNSQKGLWIEEIKRVFGHHSLDDAPRRLKKRTKSWFRAQNAAITRNQAREGFMHIHDDKTQASNRVVFLEVKLV